jgi:hypothetical protein
MSGPHLDRVSTGSGSDLVSGEDRMLITTRSLPLPVLTRSKCGNLTSKLYSIEGVIAVLLAGVAFIPAVDGLKT